MSDFFDGENIPQFSSHSDTEDAVNVSLPERYVDVTRVENRGNITQYAAQDTKSQTSVTIWVLSDSTELDDKYKQRIEALGNLSHKYLIGFSDYELSESVYWVEEQSGFENLRDRLSQFGPEEMKRISIQLLELIGYINDYTVLGQLSLDDVYVDSNSDIKVSVQQHVQAAITGSKSGTVAPEQKSSRNYQSKAADQYVVASLVKQIISHKPYRNKKGVDETLQKATQSDPLKRFKDIAALTSSFETEFKVSWQEQWLTPKLTMTAVVALALVVFISLFHAQIGQALSDLAPRSKTEIAQQSQDANTRSTTLLNQLSEYESVRKNLEKEFQGVRNPARKQAINDTLALLDENLNTERVTLLTSQIKGIDALIKSEEFDLAIEQLQNFEPEVETAYSIALYGPDVLEGQIKISALQRQFPAIGREVYAVETSETIAMEIKALRFKELMSAHITPLIEFYLEEKQRIQQNRIASLLGDIEGAMVDIPAGKFKMGIRKAGMVDAKPIRDVFVPAFKVSKYELTYNIYNQYLSLNGKPSLPGAADRPVVNLSWFDAKAFVSWLNKHSGTHYRLLTEAEWEYLARSGHKSLYFWGNSIGRDNAQCRNCRSGGAPVDVESVGQFSGNPYGVYDLNGNVWEWTQDCYASNYRGAPRNGEAVEYDDCKRRVIRGGAWNSAARELHPSYRNASKPDYFSETIGVRLAASRHSDN